MFWGKWHGIGARLKCRWSLAKPHRSWRGCHRLCGGGGLYGGHAHRPDGVTTLRDWLFCHAVFDRAGVACHISAGNE